MAEVNEVVRVSVIFDNADATVQKVELADASVQNLVDSFRMVGKEGKQAGTNIVEGVDLVGQRLEAQLNDPLRKSTLTIREVKKAQLELNDAFERAATPQQGQKIASLRRQYDGLEQEIVAAADAQDVFRTRLGGFGAQGSAGAASLIQLTRGIEDVRFGLFAAINNIEPFITSLNRLDRVAASTGVTVRQQLIGALGGPAGLLFIGQALFTAFTLLRPVVDALFDDGIEDANEFRDLLDQSVNLLSDFENFDISFKFSSDVNELQEDLDRINGELLRLQQSNQAGFNLEIGQAAVQDTVDGVEKLTFLSREELKQRQQIADFLAEGSIEGEKRLERAAEDLQFLERQKIAIEERLRLLRLLTNQTETLNRVGAGTEVNEETEEARKKREREEERIARLREKLDREIASSRALIIENEAEQEIAKVEEIFRRRIDLANELNDNEARLELEQILANRIAQIQEEAALEAEEKRRKAAEERLKQQEKLEDVLQKSRIEAIDDELVKALEAEEETFRKRIELANDQDNIAAALELQTLLEVRKTQITEEFAKKRADAELKEQARLQREADRLAREQAREFEATLREVQRFTDAFVFSLIDAARAGRGITDQEISLTLDQFNREEKELRDSLERRLIDREEFSLRIRELNLSRSNFERDVEEENASFIKRLSTDLGSFLIQEFGRRASAFIASAITQQLFAKTQLAAATVTTAAAMSTIAAASAPAAAAVSIATFGGAAATGAAAATAAILQIQSLVTGLQAAAVIGFESGGPVEIGSASGFTGNWKRNKVTGVVHGGEWVFEQPLVAKDPGAFRGLHSYLRNGGDLRALMDLYGLSGFQAGGPVGSILPSSQFISRTNDTNSDFSRINAQFAALNSNFALMQRAITELAQRPVHINIDQQNSRALNNSAIVEEKDVVPRRL